MTRETSENGIQRGIVKLEESLDCLSVYIGEVGAF